MKNYLSLIIATFMISGIMHGQTGTNTITGSVSDPEGQPISGASVLSTDGKY